MHDHNHEFAEDSAENVVVNPAFEGDRDVPDGWSFVTPRPELAPQHRFLRAEGATPARLVLEGTGDPHAFGCWQGEARLERGRWYHAAVQARITGLALPSLSLFAQVANHYLVPQETGQEEIRLEQVFQHTGADGKKREDDNKVELYLRAAAQGRVEWFAPEVMEIPRPEHRMARVATVHFGAPDEALNREGQRARIAARLDEAGVLHADIVVLPEFCPVVGVSPSLYGSYWEISETVPDGPMCALLAHEARRRHMYVLAGVIERRGNYMFNTAVLFDRHGDFVGQYDKTHLTFEALKQGFSCGSRYPVFDLDFGRIGVHICYDEWFPEVARYFAHEGVEILFLPVAGGKPLTWRTRALDNGLYFVASSITPPSMIIDSSGAIRAETQHEGVAYADLNLDVRAVNWYGDPTLSYGMPCIAPQMRNRLDDTLLESLFAAMRAK